MVPQKHNLKTDEILAMTIEHSEHGNGYTYVLHGAPLALLTYDAEQIAIH